jgi:twitching motility protein PilT
MSVDFAEILLEVMELGASDLHLTAGSPPMVRRRGQLQALDHPAMTPQVTRETIYSRSTSRTRSPAARVFA